MSCSSKLDENFLILQERPRPEYAARAPTLKENPVTGIKEPFFDPKDRIPRILSGMAAIIVMVS